MKHINLYVTVDRVRRPLGTFDLVDKDGNDRSQTAQIHAQHALGVALGKLSEEGRDVSSVSAEFVFVDTEKLGKDGQPLEFLDAGFRNEKGA
jgi:hypothetical protein